MTSVLVSGTDTPSIAGAQIDVNGSSATTDGSGYFQLYATEAERYVLTIRKSGYAFVSRIYDGAVRAGRWQMISPVNQAIQTASQISTFMIATILALIKS